MKHLSVAFLIMISLMVLCLVSVSPVISQTTNTIYIKPDGSVEPSTAPIHREGETYTFTSNIYGSSISVQRNNVIIDGSGYTLQGSGNGTGITLNQTSGVTIRNVRIEAFYQGVLLSYAPSNIIVNNIFNDNSYSIYLANSNNCEISGNVVNGKGRETSPSGGISVETSVSNRIHENNFTNTMDGVYLFFSSSSNKIFRNTVTNNSEGIKIFSSNDNVIYDNTVTRNDMVGIDISNARNNTIYGNILDRNTWNGISFVFSQNNSAYSNIVTNTPWYGITIGSSSDIAVYKNSLENNQVSIDIDHSSNNTVYENSITGTAKPSTFYVLESSDNKIFHNNFENTGKPELTNATASLWDNGYPSGGNHWGDYTGTDSNGDGIGDTPYVIDANNQDRYPLLSAYAISGLPTSPSPTTSGTLTVSPSPTVPELPNMFILGVLMLALIFASTVAVIKRRKIENNRKTLCD